MLDALRRGRYRIYQGGGGGGGGEKDTHVLLNQQGLPQKCFDLEIGT